MLPQDRVRLEPGSLALELHEASLLEIDFVKPDGRRTPLFAGALAKGSHRLPVPIASPTAGWIRLRNRQGTTVAGTFSPKASALLPQSWKHRMRLVPAGDYQIGSPLSEPGRFDDEVLHSVRLDAFWMDIHEVSEEDFARLMDRSDAPSSCPGQTCPATDLTWFDAIRYCNARSRREGLDSAYTYASVELDGKGRTVNMKGWKRIQSARGYRLPTEAEWEVACRRTTLTPWPWGSDSAFATTQAWLASNATAPMPIATRTPDANGFHDLSGNVWEWVQDWYSAYDTLNPFNPEGPKLSMYRALRGGSWRSPASELRSAYRNGAPPDYYAEDVGLRCVRPIRD
jgi:formylglycine-generating enzyme